MSIDLSNLSAKDLATLIAQAEKQQKKLSKRRAVGTVRKTITDFLKKEGYTLAEVFGGAVAAPAKRGRKPGKTVAKKASRKGSKVAPKYANPANSAETWTGRGRSPRWVAALLKKGHKVEEFLIKK